MPRTNMDGQSIRRVLEWLLNRDLTDADLAAALDMPPATFSRHKDDDTFPSFEELGQFGAAFGINPRVLQVAFGYLQLGEVVLDEAAMRQFLQQGGGNYLDDPPRVTSNDKSPPKRGLRALKRQDGVDAL